MQLQNKEFILSISGGNILTSLGGTEKVILSHQKMFNAANISYVYIYPISKKIARYELFYYWGVILDGKLEGVFSTDGLLSFLSKGDYRLLSIHIHHLRGIKLGEISKLLDYICSANIFFYLHDYYLICDEYTLTNTSGSFCGIGVPSHTKCKNCEMLKLNDNSMKRREFVFNYLDRITFVAPSEYPAEIVGDSISKIKNKIKVIHHQKMEGFYKGNKNLISDRKLRIAFCGLPINTKGWEDYLYVVQNAVENKAEIQFYHLGKKSADNENIINYPVGFQEGTPKMTETLRELKIDCVILWSKVPETYSYVYYECYSANTFIISNSSSGNIAKQVLLNDNGIVLNTRDELVELLLSNKITDQINKFKESDNNGPLNLIENDEIVRLSMNNGNSIKEFEFNKKSIKKYLVEKMYYKHMRKKQ
jgi:hypothetical protein